ncbi:MAG: VOC family protein [Flavobacteriaceae bacterium]|nr:VOC family protein [Flavobacteriaceae bacterium]
MMKIAMCSIPVTDPLKAHQFYTEILQFKSHLYMPEHQLAIVVDEGNPNFTKLLLEPNSNSISKNYQEGLYQSAIPIIVLNTEDIQQEYHRLKQLGINFMKEPTKQAWGLETVFDDTCGNYIQLVQLPN